ncbi:hypothetical protein [Lysobacter gummosus]
MGVGWEIPNFRAGAGIAPNRPHNAPLASPRFGESRIPHPESRRP